MLETPYFSKDDKDGVNRRFKTFLDSIIGAEPYKAYNGVTDLAKDLKISRQLIYNILQGKNSLSLDLLATFQNKFGQEFDARYILTNKKFVTNNLYNMPEDYVAVPVDELEELFSYTEIQKVKVNKILNRAIRQKKGLE